MRLKLRNTFVIPALIMVIAGIGIPMIVFHHYAKKEITNLINSQISQMAHSISLQLSLWIENNVLDMEDWASHGIYQLVLDDGSNLKGNISDDVASTQLMQIRKNYSWYLSLSVAGRQGEIVVTSGDLGIGRIVSEYEFFNAAQSGTSYVSETFKRTIDGRLIFVIASPVIKEGRVLGVIFGEIDMAYVDTHFIEPNKAGKTGYAFLFNRKTGSPVAHPDRTLLLNVNAEDYRWGQKLLGDTPAVVSYAYKGIHKLVAVNPVRLTQWTAAIGVPVKEIIAPVKTSIYTVIVSGGVSVVVITIAMWILTGHFVVKPVKRVVEFAEKLSRGDLSDRLPVNKVIKCSEIKKCGKTGCPFYDTGTYCMIGGDMVSDGCLPCSPTGRQCLQCKKYKKKELNEFEEMAVSLNIFAEELNKKAVMASKIAKGDFSADIRVASEKDILGKALFMMIKAVNYSAQKLKESAERVANSADRVTGFSRRLSMGASDQNRALDKIKLGISDLEERANENTKSVALANELFDEAMGAADRGALQMMNMMAGMDAISESSNAIAKIINTIDGIAFQTNLLALNASVEAARAGKHGKGFGVVAQEVRNLASRCAQAARETAELIDNSVKKVADGSENAVKTASILEEIVENVSRVADIAKKVESMSDEQTLGLEQISIAIMKIEEITRQNAVTSDETSAAGEDLLYQAMEVQNLVKHYKLKQTKKSGIPHIKESDGKHKEIVSNAVDGKSQASYGNKQLTDRLKHGKRDSRP